MMRNKRDWEEVYYMPLGDGRWTIAETIAAYRAEHPEVPAYDKKVHDLEVVVLQRGSVREGETFEEKLLED